MDLCLDVENYKLNIRTCGIIIHHNKILAHRNINKSHYALPGGRIKIGESSKEALKREMKEELGKSVNVSEAIGIVENFFEMNQQPYHEILFIHKAEFVDPIDQTTENVLHNVEGKDYLHYEWLDLANLGEYQILPTCCKEILRSERLPVHWIHDELKKK